MRNLSVILRIALLVLGVLTAFPVLSFVNPADLTTRYGLSGLDPTAEALLRHRGVLQLLMGAAMVWAAVNRSVRLPVIGAVVVSKAAFLQLAATIPGADRPPVPGVQRFDTFSIIALLIIAAWHLATRQGSARTEP